MQKKNLFYFVAAIAIFAVAFFNVSLSSQNFDLSTLSMGTMEALANNENDTEEEVRIKCYCTVGLEYYEECKANGEAERCAQSELGGNIKCTEYNTNCD